MTIYEGKGDDTLIGSVNHDAIYGGPGNDTIKGRAGDDFHFGGNGADHIDEQEGDDQLFSGKKRDRLYSGDGVDNLFGGSGRDILYSQHGVNQLNSGSGKDLIMSYSDSDTLMISRQDIAIEQVESSSIDPWAAIQDPRQVLIDLAIKRWQWRLSETCDSYSSSWPTVCHSDDVVFHTDFLDSSAGGVSGFWVELAFARASVSSTNIQVAGVDEADTVKSDGEYIYIATNEFLSIIDALPAEDIHLVAQIPLEGDSSSLYLHGDMLTVISRVSTNNDGLVAEDYPASSYVEIIVSNVWSYPRKTYTQVKIVNIDISSPEQPQIVRETTIDGQLLILLPIEKSRDFQSEHR